MKLNIDEIVDKVIAEMENISELSPATKDAAYSKARGEFGKSHNSVSSLKRMNQGLTFGYQIDPEVKRMAAEVAKMYGNGTEYNVEKLHGGANDETISVELSFENDNLEGITVNIGKDKVTHKGSIPPSMLPKLSRLIKKIQEKEIGTNEGTTLIATNTGDTSTATSDQKKQASLAAAKGDAVKFVKKGAPVQEADAEKTITSKQLRTLSAAVCQIEPDAESDFNKLSIYGNKIPMSKVRAVLTKYDIDTNILKMPDVTDGGMMDPDSCKGKTLNLTLGNGKKISTKIIGVNHDKDIFELEPPKGSDKKSGIFAKLKNGKLNFYIGYDGTLSPVTDINDESTKNCLYALGILTFGPKHISPEDIDPNFYKGGLNEDTTGGRVDPKTCIDKTLNLTLRNGKKISSKIVGVDYEHDRYDLETPPGLTYKNKISLGVGQYDSHSYRPENFRCTLQIVFDDDISYVKTVDDKISRNCLMALYYTIKHDQETPKDHRITSSIYDDDQYKFSVNEDSTPMTEEKQDSVSSKVCKCIDEALSALSPLTESEDKKAKKTSANVMGYLNKAKSALEALTAHETKLSEEAEAENKKAEEKHLDAVRKLIKKKRSKDPALADKLSRDYDKVIRKLKDQPAEKVEEAIFQHFLKESAHK